MNICKIRTTITFDEEERKVFIETMKILQHISEAIQDDNSRTMTNKRDIKFDKDDIEFFIEFCNSIREKGAWILE